MRRLAEQAAFVEPDGEPPRRNHRSDGMRARWPDTDFEKFEEADRHAAPI